MVRLFALFILLPAIELALLIEIGSRIGTLSTLGLIVVTGIVGATLARGQGLRVIQEIQRELAQGQMPAAPMIDASMIIIASALLITPGVLTDVFGFLCLWPTFRRLVRAELRRRFEKAVAEQRIEVHVSSMGQMDEMPDPFGMDPTSRPYRGPMVDVTPRRPGDRKDPAAPASGRAQDGGGRG